MLYKFIIHITYIEISFYFRLINRPRTRISTYITPTGQQDDLNRNTRSIIVPTIPRYS